MTKFTKDAPFEFESHYGTVIKVWPHVHNGTSDVMVKFGLNPAYSISRESARAVLAFDATENPDTWAWTNDEHTEARKGRWVAFACEGGSCDLEHDDLPGLTWYADESAVPASIAGVRESYQAWKSAQEQPSEPTAFGSLVRIGVKTYSRVPVTGDDGKPWIQGGNGIRVSWAELIALAPVTVLSEGVQS